MAKIASKAKSQNNSVSFNGTKLLKGVLLKQHTTFRIGGRADYFVIPRSVSELESAMLFARKNGLRSIFIGNGSNVLFGDKGFRGVVIKLGGGIKDLMVEGTRVTVGAGMTLSELSAKLAKRGISGLEFTYGVPATIGGAVVENFGAWGRQIADLVERVSILKIKGGKACITHMKRSAIKYGYRVSSLQKKGQVVFRITLNLKKGKTRTIKKKMLAILEKRRASQPLAIPNAGCVFKNPLKAPAGKLIDSCGLLGKRFGDAQISNKHANFIVNLGNATALHVITLMKKAKNEVKKKFNVSLSPEIKIIK
jgi:UDP-N-acetylmuramate dehydrogenase